MDTDSGIKTRCAWVPDDALYRRYHDHEWGVPVHDDRRLFEFLILEGMQAGLSWATILKKRARFRMVFDGFEALKISEYGEKKKASLMEDAGIIRNRRKIESAVSNAAAFLDVCREFDSFNTYIWSFVAHRPIMNQWVRTVDIPAETPQSQKMSRDLLRRGFRFVGPTICYAFMQAVGMVNDHTIDCFRHSQISRMAAEASK